MTIIEGRSDNMTIIEGRRDSTTIIEGRRDSMTIIGIEAIGSIMIMTRRGQRSMRSKSNYNR